MARPRKEMDLKGEAVKRYQELIAERGKIDQELKGLQLYLKAIGELGPQRRRGRSRLERGATNGRKPAGRGKKGSATEAVVSLITKSEKGISIDQIMKQTGLRRLTVNGILNRMKKASKVKSSGRGIYVKA